MRQMTQPISVTEQVHLLTSHLIKWRRHLHQYPELSFKEFETSRFVQNTLKNLEGMKVEAGIGVETSVVGTLSRGDGPCIALRADMDALPIKEENDCDYCSKKSGVMHACGHDAHTAILLGVATVLTNIFQANELSGTVKLIFQPAEESPDENGLSGSPYLLQNGVYDDVDMAVALHMCPWLPAGEVQINDGYSMANVDVFEGVIYGTGGHGAYPEKGTDPIWMVGPVLQAVYGIVSRRLEALESGVISIGKIHAGSASNIIPTEVIIEGTIRSYTPEVRKLLAFELQRAFSLVVNLGGNCTLNIKRGEPALYNCPRVNELINNAILQQNPEAKVTNGCFGMGGEDFGYVSQQLPSSMFFLGCCKNDEIKRELHTPIFDIDESCLPLGTGILVQTVIEFLTGEAK
ncbi:amidohydrolase [Mesobacillus maritimus]|uniref:M20 metallopeptidase family protein n=1 Tax=Mesobacillus maritimus TaxID=1643336 RepID=UPI00203EFCA0|nr:amidohydrolase [Mesobacillus maritimus]MCM3584393.1 amidohydrolase [Mesobacillus maritimus]